MADAFTFAPFAGLFARAQLSLNQITRIQVSGIRKPSYANSMPSGSFRLVAS